MQSENSYSAEPSPGDNYHLVANRLAHDVPRRFGEHEFAPVGVVPRPEPAS